MNYTEPTASGSYATDRIGEPISVSHFVHTLKRYRTTILLSLVAVALAYALGAILFFIASPSQRITTQQFRLDFEGSGEGLYPNGMKFSIADIISGPILERVYRDNLTGVISFSDFIRSIFILQSNTASELLAAEYQARLSDARLSSVDRERLQNEYELKRQSIKKNEYSINFARRTGLRTVPEPVARKVLLDILNRWADFAVTQ